MTVEIPVTLGLVALVDALDAESVSQHKWHARREQNGFYAARKVRRPDGTQETLYLHTFLTGWPLTDHRNGDGLDNRRANLRQATRFENAWNRGAQRNNTSGFKGVSWNKRCEKWQAQISVEGRYRYLGLYATAQDAALAYDAAALDLHGEFAHLNFSQAVAR